MKRALFFTFFLLMSMKGMCIYIVENWDSETRVTYTVDVDNKTAEVKEGQYIETWSSEGMEVEQNTIPGNPEASGDIIIRDKVFAWGTYHPVTEIGEYAFISTEISSVIIPSSVTHIGTCAFKQCYSLKSITLPASLTGIGELAFYNSSIETIISNIENPFPIGENMFSSNAYDDAILYVPAGTIDKYKSAEGWNRFAHIVEMTHTSIGPNQIESKNTPEQNANIYFDLQGRQLTALPTQRGIYIRNGKKYVVSNQ